MKKLYWRPSGISRAELFLIALIALVCLTAVENLPRVRRQAHFAEKVAAAQLASSAMQAIKEEKLRRGITIDPEVDPLGSGMIGSPVTPVTSNTGHLPAKLTTTNPNFAAVVVAMLREAGVNPGDTVAVGVSGSFPALNVATYAALETLQLEPIVIASAASSEWGANDEDYLWLDMEQTLFQKELVRFRSVAASRGGIDDRGFGIGREGRALLDAAIERAQLVKIEPQTLLEAIDARMNVYFEKARDKRIAAYINVGGGSASVGTHVGKKAFRSGVNTTLPRAATDSVMTRFVQEGIPVVHLSGVSEIAQRYGLPEAFNLPQRVGVGGVYARVEYNPWFAGLGIVIVLGSMFGFLRFNVGFGSLGSRRQQPPVTAQPPATEPVNDGAAASAPPTAPRSEEPEAAPPSQEPEAALRSEKPEATSRTSAAGDEESATAAKPTGTPAKSGQTSSATKDGGRAKDETAATG